MKAALKKKKKNEYSKAIMLLLRNCTPKQQEDGKDCIEGFGHPNSVFAENLARGCSVIIFAEQLLKCTKLRLRACARTLAARAGYRRPLLV